jgi:hypothetical protein
MPQSIIDLIPEDKFRRIVSDSFNYSDVMRKCGRTNVGNNNAVKKRIMDLGLDTSHFKKSQAFDSCDSQIFVINSNVSRSVLRKRVIKSSLVDHKCSICGIDSWLGDYLSLELDHINGVNNDNRIENLRFLCPNCHSQTPTWRGRAGVVKERSCLNCGKTYDGCYDLCSECIENDCASEYYMKKCRSCKCTFSKESLDILCEQCRSKRTCECGKTIDRNSSRCSECDGKRRILASMKTGRPSYTTLMKDLEMSSCLAVSKKYKVTDNTIRKWIRLYEKYSILD